MDDLETALHRAADLIAAYRRDAPDTRVGPAATRDEVAAALDPDLADGPVPLAHVVDELVAGAEPGLVCTPGPRYFGFVVGGSVDAAVVADLLTTGWDQNAFNAALSPAAMAFEDVAGRWLKELLRIPASASVGFVTGAGAANTVGLAAGRSHVLAAKGWDAGRDGLAGAPRVRIVAGAERHATIDRALRLLGIGDGTIEEVPALANGEMDPGAIEAALAAAPDVPTIVCAQAGNVNTGACDDLRAIGASTRRHGAWLHVDGAFGLWAAACPRTAALVDGVELADSWGCDGHKWLNVPYDSGYAFCAHPEVHATRWRTPPRTSPARLPAGPSAAATSRSSRRGGRAASPPGRRCGRSAARESPTSSTAAAGWRSASPTGSQRSTGSRSQTTWC